MMARGMLIIRLLTVVSVLVHRIEAQCNTNQNPSCGGNILFMSLCCPSPAVCYWKNRNGEPGCCPAGQNCLTDAATTYSPDISTGSPVATTMYVMTTYTTQLQPSTTIQTISTAPTPILLTASTPSTPAVVVITTATPIVTTVAPVGSFVTANPQYVAGGNSIVSIRWRNVLALSILFYIAL